MERVTVRMARSDRRTAWGFGVTEAPDRNVVIVNVVGGSLADRAGLRNGDVVEKLEDLGDLDINAIDRLLVTAHEKIELVVHRNPSGPARIWRPEVNETGHQERPYSVSLQHSNDTRPPQGFNTTALPFETDPRVKHMQYNSPLGIYSDRAAAEQYVQQTAGYVDNGSVNAQTGREEPAYLKSATLRLLKEEEKKGQTLSSHPNPNGLLTCFICTRPILGVMARAAGKDLHGDCLSCATCGNSLRNVGHHFIDDKFYCDIHGSQKKAGGRPGLDPDLVVRSTPTAAHPVRAQESPRAAYQPQVMQPRLSASPAPSGLTVTTHYHTPKTQGLISPSHRGVPTAAFGADLQKSVTYDSEGYGRGSVPPPQRNYEQPRSINVQVQQTSPAANYQNGNGYTKTSFERTTQEKRSYEPSSGGAAQEYRGTGSLTQQPQGGRTPFCEACKQQIRGAFVLATGLAWCPEHFVCANRDCGRKLLECGFVEENGQKFCEGCFERHIAPKCAKCTKPIVSDCLNALQKKWHPTCFTCAHCQRPFGNSAFYLEQGLPYCETDWNQLFTTKCVSCSYPIEAGDRWVEALGNAFHSNCFICTKCNRNLEGESFFAKNGRPFCKLHA